VTAGPTHEKIDPVRFIGNYSSGKMGFSIAEALAQHGAKVILIAGPVSLETAHLNIQRINVVSANEMYQAALEHFPASDGAVMCAAVADYAPVHSSRQKIKRSSESFTLELKPNPDIAAALGKMKRNGQVLVGFALETNDEQQNAFKKLQKKNLDFIVLNSLNDPGAGFQTDTNKISIINRDNNSFNFELKSKTLVAVDIVEQIILSMGL
jgi:phosphopantothenoylcysteine decarboxylase / phosphopantothenate---cysteine ligase